MGMLSAVFSGISGYILSRNGDYEGGLVSTHQWFGISLAVISIVVYISHKKNYRYTNWLAILVVLLVIVTGHLGGSLTHGSDYLTGFFSNRDQSGKGIKPIENVQEAVVYSDIIQPLFESRCYTCHNASKKKGGLRLDKPEHILRGGEDGEVILPGKAEKSDMIRRLMLPRNDDDHMPPEQKPQPKDNEIALIHWWVSTGASFDKKVNELEQTEDIKPVLFALQNSGKENIIPSVPDQSVDAAQAKDIEALSQRGAAVVKVSASSNYLSVNFVAVDSFTDNDLALLIPLKKQLIWLKLGNKKITDASLKILSQLTTLTRLSLENTLITDQGLKHLQSLKKLQYLNLLGDAVSPNGLESLKELPDLQELFLYRTNVKDYEWQGLQSIFSKVKLDSGGYNVPLFETDTTRVTKPISEH